MQREEFILLNGLPKPLLDAITSLKESDIYIMGGAITSVMSGKAINDYDLYCGDELSLRALQNQLGILAGKYADYHAKSLADKRKIKAEEKPIYAKKYFTSDNADTWRIGMTKIQVITYPKFIGPPSVIWDYFDFTICMAAYSFKESKFILHDDFLMHNSQKKLVFHHRTEYPISSLIRVLKYLRRGYTIGAIELIKIAMTINTLPMSDYKAIKKQLMGIDTLFLKPLTDWLAGRPDEKFELEAFIREYENFILSAYKIDMAEDMDNGDEQSISEAALAMTEDLQETSVPKTEDQPNA